jgi:hypothetical protein
MLVIKNIDKLVGEETGRYKIDSVKDFTNSYSFAVLDTDIVRYFRIDLMKEREDGMWVLRYSPSRFLKIEDIIVKNPSQLMWHIINLVITHRKPIKTI